MPDTGILIIDAGNLIRNVGDIVTNPDITLLMSVRCMRKLGFGCEC